MINLFDVAIIGGGVAGLAAASVFGSAENNDFAVDKTIVVFDNGRSDMLKASFKNAPGVAFGENGDITHKRMIENVEKFSSCKLYNEAVISIEKETDLFKLSTESEKIFYSKLIVLATGFKLFNISGLNFEIKQSTKTDKPRKVIPHENYRVDEGIYVCGTLADISSQFAIVAGSGAQVAIDILSNWAEKPIVIHDNIVKKS